MLKISKLSVTSAFRFDNDAVVNRSDVVGADSESVGKLDVSKKTTMSKI